jgi:hypothetical protein
LADARKQGRIARAAAAGVRAAPDEAALQGALRCACGGGCPRCRAEEVSRAVGPVQTKLDVSTPGDLHEQEADRVADEILRLPDGADSAAERVAPHDGPSVEREAAGGGRLDAAGGGDGAGAQKLPTSEAVHAAGDLPPGVREAVNSPGEPLDVATRAMMERRFGHDFDAVRVHTGETAARSARELEATAYTVGRELVFAEGKYTPTTTEGRHLIAHELTHVVQQSAARGPAAPASVQRQPRQRSEAEIKERKEACVAQTDEILPGRVGVLVHIDRDQQLEEIFGADYPALKKQIQASRPAREFVCDAGVPAIVALAESRSAGPLDATGALDVAAARESLKSHPERYARAELVRRQLKWRLGGAKERLEQVGTWARTQERQTGAPSATAVQGPLPAAEAGALEQATAQLEASVPLLMKGKTKVADALKQFDEINKQLQEAREAGRQDYKPGALAAIKLRAAADAAGAAQVALGQAYAGAEVGGLIKQAGELKAVITEFADDTARADSLDTNTLGDLRKEVQKVAAEIRKERQRLDAVPDAAQRILFVLRYFRALNAPNFAGAPSADDQEKFKGKIDALGNDLETVFGGRMGLSLIPDVATQVGQQLGVRSAMQTALGRQTALVPTQQDVEAHFASLAGATNAEVIDAYQNYARAFFFHRGISSSEDLRGGDVQALYQRPLSITGTRPLVCTGYALLGARLFQAAGARLETYILGVRVGDEQLAETAELSDAHALARLRRKDQTLFISNDSVVFSQNDGFSPDALAWDNPNNPIFIGTGTTIDAAVDSMIQSVDKARPAARKRLGRH